MPNEWGDEVVATQNPPTNAWGDVAEMQSGLATAVNEWGDAADAAEPTSSVVVDVAKRAGRGAAKGAAHLAQAGARFSDAWHKVLPGWAKEREKTAEEKAADDAETRRVLKAQGHSDAWIDEVIKSRNEHPLDSLSRGMHWLAGKISPDPARDTELKSAIAEGAGSAVPALASAAFGPVGPVVVLGAQSGEAEREASLAAGDTPEMAAEKAKLGRLGGAVMGAIPGGPVRGSAGVLERLATRSATGAAINAAQDAGMQLLVDQKIDWGRVKTNGAIGAGLGLVLGIPEALAIRKAFGTQTPHEGKSLQEVIQEVATETKQPPSAVQQRINEMVGISEVADAAPSPTPAAPRAAEVIDAAVGVPKPATSAADTLFAERLRRQGDAEQAFGVETPESMKRRADDFTKARAEVIQEAVRTGQLQGSEVVVLGDDPVRNRITALDTRPGEAARERARLMGRSAEEPARGPRMSMQAQRLYDEHGGINPDAMMLVARTAVGGGLGYASGDTPEERVRNALLGMGFGGMASPALARSLTSKVINAPASQEIAEQAKQRLTELRLRVAPKSILPEEIRTQLRWGEQATSAVTNSGLSLTGDLERAVVTIGDKAAQAEAAVHVQEFLTGARPAAALAAPLRAPAEKVRNFVDALTDRAVAEGVVSGPMAQTFLSNRGSYLRRSYEIFLNPDYKPAPAVVNNAINAVARANGLARTEAEGIVAGILDKNSRSALGDFLIGRGKLGGKDVGSLVQRQDLLPEVRALLGEVTDPILATNQTIPRMARLIENDAAQKQVRAIGLRLGLFSEAQSMSHPSRLVAETSATHDVLGGLFTQPEIAAAMQKEAGRAALVPEVLWKGLTSLSSVAKMSKTVLNPESYAPNVIGGIISNLGNANFRYSHAGRALALGAEELGALRQFMPGSPSRDSLRAELGELRKLGVLGESVNSEDLLRTIQSSFFAQLSDRAKNVLTLPSRVYGSVDEFNRYVAYQSERVRYARAFPNATADEIKRRAAEVVRSTTPVYSEVPNVVKQLSVAGLTPSFVNFTWEVFRNTRNSVRIGLHDLREGRATGNAGLVRAGAERLAALTAVVSSASMFGLSKLSRDEHKIDDATDDAVRYFSPPWNREGVLVYHTGARGGKPVQVSNLSYLVPHALLFQAIEAGTRAEEGEGVEEFVRALNGQFGFGNSVLIPPLAGAIQGFEPSTGRQIPSSDVTPTIGDRVKYFAKEALEPLAVSQAEKWRKAFAGEQGDYGRVYSVQEQTERLFGIRAQTVDPVRAMQWTARDLAERLQRAEGIYRLRLNRQKKEQRMPWNAEKMAAALERAYDVAELARQREFSEIQTMIGHARQLGVRDDDIISALRSSGVSAPAILDAFDDHYTPIAKQTPKTAAERYAELMAKPAQARQAEIARLYREDKDAALSVINRAREEAKGRTQTDKLILSLGVTDGERAEYLRRRLSEIPTTEARRSWLVDLQRKGILTERVFQQMSEARRRDK